MNKDTIADLIHAIINLRIKKASDLNKIENEMLRIKNESRWYKNEPEKRFKEKLINQIIMITEKEISDNLSNKYG